MHPCPGDSMAITRTVVYFACPAHAFSAGIKCWHCSSTTTATTSSFYTSSLHEKYLEECISKHVQLHFENETALSR